MSEFTLSPKALAGLWGQHPMLDGEGHSSGVTAALWDETSEAPFEITSPPDPKTHILCIQTKAFRHDTWYNGKLALQGELAPGQASLVRAGVHPRAILYGSFGGLQIYIPDRHVLEIGRDAGIPGYEQVELICPGLSTDTTLTVLGNQLTTAMKARDGLTRLMFDGIVLAISTHLISTWSSARGQPRLRMLQSGGLAPRKFRLVTDYLMAHLTEDMALAELAAIAGLSPHHFCRAFKLSTGLPPHAWLTARRIERAEELMVAQPGLVLSEVALACGFADQSHFTRTFTRVRGVSPGRWRRERLA